MQEASAVIRQERTEAGLGGSTGDRKDGTDSRDTGNVGSTDVAGG